MTSLRRIGGGALAIAGFAILVVLGLAMPRASLESPAPTLMLQDAQGRFLGEVPDPSDERLGFWPVEEVPERVVAATLAIEDRRMREHPGVDPVAVVRALRDNASTGRRVSGASTLAMQVARIQRPGQRTYPRKVLEATTALLLVNRYGHDAILAHYLQIAPYGNNVHGIGYAARRYFDKPVEDLSWAQVALLTALPQAPGQMNPYTRSGRTAARARALRILDLLREDGTLDAQTWTRAVHELDDIEIPDRPVRPPAALHPVLALSKTLGQPQERARHAHQPVLRTTLDLPTQQAVEAIVDKAITRFESKGAGNAAIVVVDLETGGVVADVGSTAFFDTDRKGSIDYSRTPRYPGSTLKPFVYALGLDRGVITPTTVVEDLGRAPGGVGNADGRYLGPVLPRRALANSRNVPTVRLARDLSLGEVYGTFRALGLHDDELPAEHYGLGLAIGGMPTSLLQLVEAYGALANDGTVQPLRWLADEPPKRGTQVFSPESSRLVARWLSDPMARLPTFPRMGYSEYPYAVAVKTGTSPDYRDAWAVGWSKRYLVGVWVGHPDWRPMQRLSGYRAGASLVQRVLHHLHGELDDFADHPMPAPDGHRRVQLCAMSGARAGDACDSTHGEWLPVGVEPGDCTVHLRRAVDARTGALANAGTPPEAIEFRTFLDLRGIQAGWARRTGQPLLPGREVAEAPAVTIVSPAPGAQVMADPEAPAGNGTIAFRADVRGDIEQILWTIDGEPVALAGAPFTVRWPVVSGEHVIRAHDALGRVVSTPVRITAW